MPPFLMEFYNSLVNEMVLSTKAMEQENVNANGICICIYIYMYIYKLVFSNIYIFEKTSFLGISEFLVSLRFSFVTKKHSDRQQSFWQLPAVFIHGKLLSAFCMFAQPISSRTRSRRIDHER